MLAEMVTKIIVLAILGWQNIFYYTLKVFNELFNLLTIMYDNYMLLSAEHCKEGVINGGGKSKPSG